MRLINIEHLFCTGTRFIPNMFLLVVNLVAVSAVTLAASQDVTITTGVGRVRGREVEVLGKPLHVFLGIPFAKPPVGELRFKRPLPADPWDEELQAFDFPAACLQPPALVWDEVSSWVYSYTTDVSEDCLYLNVWAPADASNAAVMIWIHGGGFVAGSARDPGNSGAYLAAEGNVIVVTLQYRLGLPGFLYLGTEDVPGNMGLLDQHLAIGWVKRHISAFGGDNGRITVFGESAGAASTMMQILTSQPRHFNRGIIQSSPSVIGEFGGVASNQTALGMAESFLYTFNCTGGGRSEQTSCLRSLTSADIITKTQNVIFPFIQDGYFLNASVGQRLLTINDNGPMDVIMGTQEYEYLFFYLIFNFAAWEQPRPSFSQNELHENIASILGVDPDNEYVLEYVAKLFRGDHDLDNFTVIDSVYTGYLFTCPTIHFAKEFLRRFFTVFLYQLKKKPSNRPFPEWAQVTHSESGLFALGRPLDQALGYDAEDTTLARQVVTFWTNFAKTGMPDDGPSDDLPWSDKWPRFNGDDWPYMVLDSPQVSLAHDLMRDQCVFIDKVLPELNSGRSLDKLLEEYQLPSANHGISFTVEGKLLAVSVIALMVIFSSRLN